MKLFTSSVLALAFAATALATANPDALPEADALPQQPSAQHGGGGGGGGGNWKWQQCYWRCRGSWNYQ
ncbi:hypothetical protein GGI09_005457, partial [Coemansia sp. S100]